MQKRILRIVILSFLSFFVIIATTMYFRLGLYKDPILKGKVTEGFQFIYVSHLGPYHEVLETFQKIESFMQTNQLSCRQSIGQYLDNPEKMDPDRLRSRLGCLVGNSFNPESLSEFNNPDNLKVEYLKMEPKEFLKYEFSGSPAVGPIKVYPEAMKWFEKNKIKKPESTIEIYSLDGDKALTEYYYPIK